VLCVLSDLLVQVLNGRRRQVEQVTVAEANIELFLAKLFGSIDRLDWDWDWIHKVCTCYLLARL